jgi:hypothetical protein
LRGREVVAEAAFLFFAVDFHFGNGACADHFIVLLADQLPVDGIGQAGRNGFRLHGAISAGSAATRGTLAVA